jgi:hypothetical protein
MPGVQRRSSAAVAAICLLLTGAFCPAADDLVASAKQRKAKFAAELDKLAAWCDGQGLAEQGKQTRAVLGPSDPFKLYLPILPRPIGPPPLPADAPASVAQWQSRLAQLRQNQAQALYDLASKAARDQRGSLAHELVLEALRADPDCEPGRRILGYQKYDGGWYTAYEVRKLKAGQVWHDKFGWLPKEHVPRYEKGERWNGKRWITAETDAKGHVTMTAGWEIETEHYAVRTNHSLEAGVSLGAKLEQLYHVWRQMFVRYYASEKQILDLFEGRIAPSAGGTRLSVYYFRDRKDYVRALGKIAGPQIQISSGYYNEALRRAFFYADKQADDRNLFHEATHQLFHQSRPVAANVGAAANFWIVEGIAMYFESLHREGDYYVLGGLDDERLVAARVRLLKDGFYVPLAQVSALGMGKLQSDPRIAMLYSEFAGLTHFLVYYDNGRYREALVAYLTAVYGGQDDPGTLGKLTGVSYAELDEQYRQFCTAAEKLAPTENRKE